MRRTPRLFILPFVLLLLVPSLGCDFIFPDCSGADGLRPEHEAALACAGWLVFVQDHIGQISYEQVERLPGDGHATGRAFCRSCRVEIAALERQQQSPFAIVTRDSVEVASILVHEATHLDDGCENGEAPAEAAEAQFLIDYALKCP